MINSIAELFDSVLAPSTLGMIRVGNEHDGGYVIPDDLDGVTHALSFGICYDWSFDSGLSSRGIKVFMYDHTVPGPPPGDANMVFYREPWREPETGLADMLGPGGDCLLKFDVEGDEWPNLAAIGPDDLKRFRIITCEFHDMQSRFDPAVFAKLARHHKLIHIHGNNYAATFEQDGRTFPQVVEMTFLRTDRGEFHAHPGPLPGPMDRPCHPGLPDIPIDFRN